MGFSWASCCFGRLQLYPKSPTFLAHFWRWYCEESFYLKDRRRYKVWKQNIPQKLSGKDFLDLFLEYKTDYAYDFVKSVLKNDVLEKNKNSVEALSLAIQHIESSDESRKHIQLIDDMCILLERMQSAKEN